MKKSDFANITLYVLFKVLIEFLYLQILNPRFEYMGLTLDYNPIKNLESYIILIIVYLLLDKTPKKASVIFLQIIFTLSIVPILAIYGMKNESRLFLYLSVGAFLLTVLTVRYFSKLKNSASLVWGTSILLFLYALLSHSWFGVLTILGSLILIFVLLALVPGIRMPYVKHSQTLILLIIVGISIITYALMIRDNGLPTLSAFNFNDTYEVRSQTVHNPITAYLIPWQANVINIFLLAFFFLRKDYAKMSVMIGLQLLLFAITAHKTYLFAPFAIVALLYIIEKRNFIRTMMVGLIGLNILALLTWISNITPWLIAIITHRLHFMPAQISFYYFDYFSSHGKLFFSEGMIGRIFGLESPYPIKAFNLIGSVYFNNEGMNANTWYIADAYSNGGIFGLFIISILFAILLIAVDSLTVDYKITIAALFMPVFSLINGSLLTSLFTTGMMMGILIVALISNLDHFGQTDRRILLAFRRIPGSQKNMDSGQGQSADGGNSIGRGEI